MGRLMWDIISLLKEDKRQKSDKVVLTSFFPFFIFLFTLHRGPVLRVCRCTTLWPSRVHCETHMLANFGDIALLTKGERERRRVDALSKRDVVN